MQNVFVSIFIFGYSDFDFMLQRMGLGLKILFFIFTEQRKKNSTKGLP